MKQSGGTRRAQKRRPEPLAPQVGIAPIARAALYAVALALTVAGVMNGGMRDVLVKAVNICTECIGLG